MQTFQDYLATKSPRQIDNIKYNSDVLLEALENDWMADVVKLSQMVEDGKLNSNGAKEVFKEMYKTYRKNRLILNTLKQAVQ